MFRDEIQAAVLVELMMELSIAVARVGLNESDQEGNGEFLGMSHQKIIVPGALFAGIVGNGPLPR